MKKHFIHNISKLLEDVTIYYIFADIYEIGTSERIVQANSSEIRLKLCVFDKL